MAIAGGDANLEIHLRSLGESRLVRDYLAGAEALRPFYNGSPWSLESYRRKCREVDRRFDAGARDAMARAITPSSERAAAKLARVVEEGGFLVTTGQQAGLFSGPLYTTYKILSTIQLAAALERALDRPVAPLFWAGTEDHDWAEVDHTYVLDTSNELCRIDVVQPPDAPPVSMAHRRLGPEIDAARAALERALPPTDFTPALLDAVASAYSQGTTMGAAFRDLLREWFAPFDLLLTDAAHPQVKALSAGLLRREVEHAAQAEAAVARQTARLEAAGYDAQVTVVSGAANILFEDEHGRDRIAREGEGWIARGGAVRWSDRELMAALEAAPERFSPNVLLRPVVESAVFPTLAYVAGPAELTYFAQLGGIFAGHHVEMPIVFPRHAAAVVEPKVRKVLHKFDLDIADLEPPLHEIASRFARDELPRDVADGLAALRRSIQEGYGALETAARQVDPTLEGPARSARASSFKELDHFEKKVLRQLKERNRISLRQIEKARANLFPDGRPQERVLNPAHFLARFGSDFLRMLADRFQVDPPGEAPDWGPTVVA